MRFSTSSFYHKSNPLDPLNPNLSRFEYDFKFADKFDF
jgi:hypothetical protein